MTNTEPAAETELVYDDTPAPPGRRVRLEPTPPGFWRLLLGSVLALLAPFFGILIGSTLGSPDADSRMEPLYWGFFIGGLIGVVGLVVASFGGATLIRHSRSKNREEDS
ncbi:hypothetical protein GCM10022261_01030 [Brevibacterium daeguense]|uniref:Uncharacterized protein n=1 Tax=Brevibacterium daeguense TaxID=909936 RepID=A0ABP8EF20_9MICO|nr:hypothetical protein [Brevibacterium daeguense]